MEVEIITKKDLKLFKEEMLDAIEKLLQKNNSSTSEWLRSRQVREMLNISPNTLQNLRIKGEIQYTKVGGIFLYNVTDLKETLNGKQGRDH
ncbi:helix-turn-helix domain-containing protein [Mucilaginibacter agri]|uniref:Helix-turn-helix domain-containing protein n=1 Tax=Mucilaginibacter agri TaxID=2695265 RepID=A0A966DS13_9SPHI|nr:helix-turn-helix domain-containing protein [Mucilaginibacter agri]NCD69085.1 helix-turn-helix domain-containing protein [Mucilaginibacter agri]